MNRRGFLGSLLAVAAAPALAPEASANWLKRLFSKAKRVIKRKPVPLPPHLQSIDDAMQAWTKDIIKKMNQVYFSDGQKLKALKEGRGFNGLNTVINSPITYGSIKTDTIQPPSA